VALSRPRVPAGLSLVADEEALAIVLDKLLANAVKFNRPGGTVSLEAWITAQGDLVLQVADTGIGMSEEDLARIRPPFGQADETLGRRYEGIGLSLTVVGGLVRLHGGTLAIDSRPGRGTTVAMTFPASRVPTPPSAPPAVM
jgi:signal transduction histidine kinase